MAAILASLFRILALTRKELLAVLKDPQGAVFAVFAVTAPARG